MKNTLNSEIKYFASQIMYDDFIKEVNTCIQIFCGWTGPGEYYVREWNEVYFSSRYEDGLEIMTGFTYYKELLKEIKETTDKIPSNFRERIITELYYQYKL